MNPRTAAWVAWSTWTVSTALLVPALLILRSEESPLWLNNLAILLPYGMWVMACSTVGALVASRRAKNPIGWILCAMGLLFGVGYFAAQYATYTLLAHPDTLAGGKAMAWVSSWVFALATGLMAFLLLLFPNGRLPTRRWRWFAWLGGVVIATGAISGALLPGPIEEVGPGPIRNPLGIEGARSVLSPLSDASGLATLVLLLVSAASLFLRLRYARGEERQQIKWFAFAAALLASGAFLHFGVAESAGTLWASFALMVAGLLGIPVAVGIAILRYRLYEIDLLINRTLVYGALTVMLAAVYFGGVAASQTLFRVLTGQHEQPQLAIVVSTLVIAALFTPLRRSIQSFIDRRFYRSKYDARKTLEAFSAKLRDETDLEALNNELVRVVRETMQPTHVSLWLRSPTEVGQGRESSE